MFLGVSVTLLPVDMNDEERAALAALVTSERRRQFGTRSGAYRAAGLNATTWQRVEDGLPVREDRLTAAVRALWPSSGGDWRKVTTTAAAERPLSTYTDRALLDELEARLTEREVRDDGHEPAPIVGETVSFAAPETEVPPTEASPPHPGGQGYRGQR